MDILVRVDGQKISIADNRKYFIEGSQEFVRFHFALDDSWKDLKVFAQFIQGGEGYNIFLDTDNSAYLPPEIVAGTCQLLIYGTGGEVRATTNCLTLTVDENLLIADGKSTVITQSLYEQIINAIEGSGVVVGSLTFNGNQLTSTGSYTPSGTVTITQGSDTANYTPEGSVSQPAFTGNELTSTGEYTPSGNVAISKGNGTVNYTPEGVVSTPTITVSTDTQTINGVADVGTLPIFTATVSGKNLIIGFNPGSLPTKGSDTTVVTGVSSVTSSQPTFTGTGVDLEGTFTGNVGSIAVKGTPSGTVDRPIFTGTGVNLSGSFNGKTENISVNGTPTGTISRASLEEENEP